MEIRVILIPTGFFLSPCITIPLQVPMKTNRSIFSVHNDPNTTEKCTFEENSFGVSSHHFQVQNTATFPQFNRTQRKVPMLIPFIDYTNKIHKNQTVTIQTNRSNDHTFLLKTITTTVPTLSRPPLAPLNFADTYSLSSTTNNPFQTNTNLNATADQCQNLLEPHTARKIGPSAYLPSSSSTVNPTKPSSVKTQIYTISYVVMNKSVKVFDGLDHHYTHEEYLHQIDPHMIFTVGEQPLDPIGYNQRHKRKMAYFRCSLSGIA